MLLKGADSIGLKIISVKDNSEIGTVEDLIYDPKENKIIAFLVTEGGIITEPKVIPFNEITNITEEAVLIKSSKSIKPGSKAVKPLSTSDGSDTYLKDTTIITEKGKELGQEKDLIFDTKTGKVQQFEVHQNNETKEVKIAEVITSSPSTTVIKEENSPQSSEESGGIMEKAKQLLGK